MLATSTGTVSTMSHGVNAAGDLLMYYGDGHGGWKGVETVGWGWNIFNGLY
ncbi:hypothetical protein NtRootA1_44480 [Arthrobacter sp. NtRootA1]|nr:hypothetical protein NtRootA1_44480 [Arthrobacter sp. NtRootA1]